MALALSGAVGGDANLRSVSGTGSVSFKEVWQHSPDVFSRGGRDEDDEEELRWTAIERLPTFKRVSKGLLQKVLEDGSVKASEIDLTKLSVDERSYLMNKILNAVEEDHERFLRRLRSRTDRVGIETTEIEIRYEHLSVEGDVHVGSRALPTLINATMNAIEV